MRRWTVKTLAWALSAFLMGAAAVSAAEPILQRGNRTEPATLDPARYQTHYEGNVILDLFEGLFTYNIAARPVLGVAQSWKVSDDGLTWSFVMKPYLKWSDGTPLTAEDVVYSLRRAVDPRTAAQYAQLIYVLKNGKEVTAGALPPEKLGAEAPDKGTVILKLAAPTPYLAELLANPFAAVVPRHVIEKYGKDWTKPGNLVSNGAYMLKAWLPQDHIELVKNPNFHDADKVSIPRVNFWPTENLTASLARFKADELDMMMEFPAARFEELRKDVPEETKTGPSLLTYYLALNTAVPKLSDVRVRRALALAVDREVLTERITRAGEKPAYTFIPPGIASYSGWTHVDAALTPQQRLETAKKMLAEAGYGPGKPLKLTYSFSATEDLKRIAVAIQSMWKRIGVETELVNRESRVHFAALKTGDFEVGFAGWAADYNDPTTFLYVLQSSTVNSNYSRYNNPAFDALVARAGKETAVVARSLILQEAEKTALSDQPIVPLFNAVTRNLISRRVQGWRPNPLDFYLSRYLSLSGQTP